MWEEGCCIGLSSTVLESFVCFYLVGVLVLGSGEGVVGRCRCMHVCLSCPCGPGFLGLLHRSVHSP